MPSVTVSHLMSVEVPRMPHVSVDDTLRGILDEYRTAFSAQSVERRRQRRQLVETTMDHLRKFMPHHHQSVQSSVAVSPIGVTLVLPPVTAERTSTPLPMPDVLAESIVNNPPAFTSKEEIMQRLAQVYQGVTTQPSPSVPTAQPVASVASVKPAIGPAAKAELMETLRKLYAS